MALEVSMTGTGTIGDIAPGWSVNEFGTGITIGETSAGTGSVSFSAKAKDDSLLVINNDVVSNVNGLGNVTGVVQSVSETGLNASVTHGTFLDKFNLDVDVSPVDIGGPYKWFYSLGQSVFGSDVAARPDYGYPGTTYKYAFSSAPIISAPSYCFPFDGDPTDVTNTYSVDQVFTKSTRKWSGELQGYAYESSLNTAAWLNFDATETPEINGMRFAFGSVVAGPAPYPRIYNRLYLQFSAMVDSSTRIYFGNKFGNTASPPTYFNCLEVDINGASNVISIKEMETETSETASIASLDKTQPILFTVIVGGDTMFFPYDNLVATSLSARDHTGTSVVTSGVNVEIVSSSPWRIVYDSINTSYMGFVNMGSTTSTVPTTYITPDPIEYNYDIDFSGYTQDYIGAYPSTSGVAWELMQQIAAAENFEISVNEDTLVVRDIGTRVVDITNVAASPTINPQSTLSGKQINIPYSDARFVSGVVYDARADGNNVISVDAGATTITSVKFDVNPITVKQPIRYLADGTGAGAIFVGPLPEGNYFVSDSTGLPISANQWEDYGASVNVAIDPEDNSAIQVTVKGPKIEIPSTTGPYSLEANDGASSFAALNITGTGVYNGGNVLQLLTGVDSEKYTRATVNTINNPFVTGEEKAYDRGAWAALKAAGPVVTMNAAIPVSSISGVGLTCGSLVNYRNSTYRILSSTIGSLSVSIFAEFYVTVDNVDDIWGTQTVAQFDAAWGALECQDQIVFPYKVA